MILTVLHAAVAKQEQVLPLVVWSGCYFGHALDHAHAHAHAHAHDHALDHDHGHAWGACFG